MNMQLGQITPLAGRGSRSNNHWCTLACDSSCMRGISGDIFDTCCQIVQITVHSSKVNSNAGSRARVCLSAAWPQQEKAFGKSMI
jgi:hypothetical protein